MHQDWKVKKMYIVKHSYATIQEYFFEYIIGKKARILFLTFYIFCNNSYRFSESKKFIVYHISEIFIEIAH